MYEAERERGARTAKQRLPLYSPRCLEEAFSAVRSLGPKYCPRNTLVTVVL
jgi:hypothetical protein